MFRFTDYISGVGFGRFGIPGLGARESPAASSSEHVMMDTCRSNNLLLCCGAWSGVGVGRIIPLVAEWIHFPLFGIISPTIKLKVYTFGGL